MALDWCAHYEDDDLLGFLLALASNLPYLVILDQASKAYSRRDIKNLIILVGLIVNEGLAKAIKQIVKQPRPMGKCMQLGTCDSYGWPSSHTQCMFFFLGLHLYQTIRNRLSTQGKKWPKLGWLDSLISLLESTVLLLASLTVGYSRYYLTYHTREQVVVGAIFGLSFSLAWGLLVMLTRVERVLMAVIPLASQLRVRSSLGLPDHVVVESERSITAKLKGHEKKQK